MNKAVHPGSVSPAESTTSFEYLELLGRVKKALDSAKEIKVPATDIRRYPDQPREDFDEAHIKGLAESIDAGGQTTPGLLRYKPAETPYELIDGECRWRGINLIPEERRPLYKASLIEADDEVIQFLVAGVANFNRKGHTALETMRAIERFVSFKLPMHEIARLLGISEVWASQMHGLRKLAPEVQKMMSTKLPRAEQLPVTAAIHISKIDAKHQLGLAQRVLHGDITLNRLRGEVVKTARKHGVEIRERVASQSKQWDSFETKVDAASRFVGDAYHLIKKGTLDRFARANSASTSKMLKDLQAMRGTISQIESCLRQARS